MRSLEKLKQLILKSNPSLDLTKIVISNPTSIDPLTHRIGHNTAVAVKAGMLSNGYTGGKVFTYQRLDIATAFNGIDVAIDAIRITSFQSAIDYINERYGIDISADDFVESMPDIENGFILTANETNYEYIGTLVFPHRISIEYVVENAELDGFEYVEIKDSRAKEVEDAKENYDYESAIPTVTETQPTENTEEKAEFTLGQNDDFAVRFDEIKDGEASHTIPPYVELEDEEVIEG